MAVTVRGVPLELHPSPDYLSDYIRRTGDFYEANILDYLRDRLADEPPGVLVDVGAMIGNHAAYFEAFVRHTVTWAFEPYVEHFLLLLQNAEYATSWKIALSDYGGTASLETPDPGNRGHAIVRRNWSGEEVPVRTLDSFNIQDVRLIKIDTEGTEPAVIRGARQTIDRCRPLLLVEDWTGELTIPGYHISQAWPDQQTYLYEPETE